ncbi:TetR/AcrR family transcriptional regulator [Mycolicibacterium komossense]|uniref:TetR/AcrR family transcriptional regulator n=1 Tax=Mycolicibacterium komossense TaxID=1779 RepID=A0ABT3C676_9MYCO|nr:TetR/AcrR family transcriptional regulator [Mycolicibacterium komossense]MCV7224983.1 TetR/AcrR family transcriptional regulator [Mycolicibacterium komossense]
MTVQTQHGEPKLSLRERNRLRTRRELLDAALEVFSEDGFGSATVEKIAERAGAAKGTLYTYFPQGREQLFCELYEEINNELIDKATEIYSGAEGGDFSSRLVAMSEAVVDVAERPMLGRFYAIDDPSLDQALPPVRGHASSVIAQHIAKDYAATVSRQPRSRSAVAPESIAMLLTGALTAALSTVARGTQSRDDVCRAIAAVAAGLMSST